MEAKEQEYGVAEERRPELMGAQEERSWSVLAHLSIFLNLFTGFLGPVAALVIWLVYKLGVGWALTGLLTLILIGFLLIPVMALATVVPFVHAAYAAYRVSNGDDYRYAFVADLIQAR
jgi:uncharacterized Tic20 family protein